jgi:hypothetical protein
VAAVASSCLPNEASPALAAVTRCPAIWDSSILPGRVRRFAKPRRDATAARQGRGALPDLRKTPQRSPPRLVYLARSAQSPLVAHIRGNHSDRTSPAIQEPSPPMPA